MTFIVETKRFGEWRADYCVDAPAAPVRRTDYRPAQRIRPLARCDRDAVPDGRRAGSSGDCAGAVAGRDAEPRIRRNI